MTNSIQIEVSERERNLLNLCASKESAGGNYNALFSNTYDNRITDMTIAQILEFQTKRIQEVNGSAIGRYQFIRSTLEGVVTQYAGWGPEEQRRIRFTPKVQDYLILLTLKRVRRLDDWLSGKLPSIDFQLKLAMEFASVPVPYDVTKTKEGQTINIPKGSTYYPETGSINKAGHDADAFLQKLEDILQGGRGEVEYVEVSDGGTGTSSGAYPKEGNSSKAVAEYATAGGNKPTGGHKTTSTRNTQFSLPSVGDVYEDEPIDPHDNRYDFRTGKMVRDIGINGTYPVGSNPNYTDRKEQSPGVADGPQVTGQGSESATSAAAKITRASTLSPEQQSYAFGSNPITDTSDPNYYDPRLGNVSTSAAVSPTNIPSGVSGGRGMPATAPPTNGPLTGGTTTNSTERKSTPPGKSNIVSPF